MAGECADFTFRLSSRSTKGMDNIEDARTGNLQPFEGPGVPSMGGGNSCFFTSFESSEDSGEEDEEDSMAMYSKAFESNCESPAPAGDKSRGMHSKSSCSGDIRKSPELDTAMGGSMAGMSVHEHLWRTLYPPCGVEEVDDRISQPNSHHDYPPSSSPHIKGGQSRGSSQLPGDLPISSAPPPHPLSRAPSSPLHLGLSSASQLMSTYSTEPSAEKNVSTSRKGIAQQEPFALLGSAMGIMHFTPSNDFSPPRPSDLGDPFSTMEINPFLENSEGHNSFATKPTPDNFASLLDLIGSPSPSAVDASAALKLHESGGSARAASSLGGTQPAVLKKVPEFNNVFVEPVRWLDTSNVAPLSAPQVPLIRNSWYHTILRSKPGTPKPKKGAVQAAMAVEPPVEHDESSCQGEGQATLCMPSTHEQQPSSVLASTLLPASPPPGQKLLTMTRQSSSPQQLLGGRQPSMRQRPPPVRQYSLGQLLSVGRLVQSPVVEKQKSLPRRASAPLTQQPLQQQGSKVGMLSSGVEGALDGRGENERAAPRQRGYWISVIQRYKQKKAANRLH